MCDTKISVEIPIEFNNNYALDFDGSNDYIDLGNPASLIPANFITMSAWINSNNTTGSMILAKDDDTSPFELPPMREVAPIAVP